MTTTDENTLPELIPRFDIGAESGREIAIICSKGSLDMACPGLILANAALGEGVEIELDVPDVPEFLEQIVASGGHLWACRMSADLNHLTENDLYENVEGIISASDFIEKTDGAQLLFI